MTEVHPDIAAAVRAGVCGVPPVRTYCNCSYCVHAARFGNGGYDMINRKLFRNSEVIYCASSLDHCWELFESDMDLTRAEEEQSDPFEEIPGDEIIEICYEDEPEDEPTRTMRMRGKYSYWFVSKLAREWAAESPPGHFSGGDY